MTSGTRTVQFPYTDTNPNNVDGGKWGYYTSKTWNGGNAGKRPYTTEVHTVPGGYFPRQKKDGTWQMVYQKPRSFRKRIYSTAFRAPQNYTATWKHETRSRIRVYPGQPPYVNINYYQMYHQAYIESVPTLAQVFTSNDDIKLINKLGERIADVSFNPAVFLAEANQSLKMIGDNAARIAKSIAYLRKGRYKQALEAVSGHKRHQTKGKTAAQLVLEVQYGWRPLLSDVYEGAQYVASKLNPPVRLRVSARLERRAPCGYNTAVAGVSFIKTEAVVRKQIIAYLETIWQNPELNIWNPAQVLWEKTPWSFVVDWFIPIGSYLEAAGVASKLKGTFVTSTLYTKTMGGYKASQGGSVNYTKTRALFDDGGLGLYWQEGSFQRSVSSSLGIPDLPSFKGFRRALSFEHAINGIALLVGSRSGNPDRTLRNVGSFERGRNFTRWGNQDFTTNNY